MNKQIEKKYFEALTRMSKSRVKNTDILAIKQYGVEQYKDMQADAMYYSFLIVLVEKFGFSKNDIPKLIEEVGEEVRAFTESEDANRYSELRRRVRDVCDIEFADYDDGTNKEDYDA